MFVMQVQYTVRPEFAPRNQHNITRVMEEVRNVNPSGFRYSVFLKEDGKTFVHLVMGSEENKHLPSSLPAFQEFQKELLASDLEIRPEFSEMTLVGSSSDL